VLFGAVGLRAPRTCVRGRARTDRRIDKYTGADQRDCTKCDCVRVMGGVYSGDMKWRKGV